MRRRHGLQGGDVPSAPEHGVGLFPFGYVGSPLPHVGLGTVVLRLDRLRVARGRSEHAIGWVLVLCGAFVVVDALIWMSIGAA
jgi:hypothetical protein